MSIKLIVDSSADMPDYFIEKYDIKVVPLSIKFGDKEYADKVDLKPHEFYRLLEASDHTPITGQVTPIKFKKAFEQVLEDGDEAIVITISSNASGTMQSANIAKNELETDKITIIDSNSLCLGHSYIAILAAQMIEKGYTREEVEKEIVPYTNNKVEHLFCVNTLEYLVKGGRIKAYKAFFANVLNIKPILTVHDGITKPIGKVRSKKRIIPYYIDKIKKEMDTQTPFVLVGHSCDAAFAKKFVDKFKEELNFDKPIYIGEVGATIGTHSGPGVLSVFYLRKEGFDD